MIDTKKVLFTMIKYLLQKFSNKNVGKMNKYDGLRNFKDILQGSENVINELLTVSHSLSSHDVKNNHNNNIIGDV